MPPTIAYLIGQASIVLNAATGQGSGGSSIIGPLDDPKKFPSDFLSNAALDADAEVNDIGCASGNPLWDGFIVDSSAAADNTVVLAPGGGIVYDIFSVKVDGVDARKAPTSYLERMRTDPLSRTAIDKYYNIEGGKVIRHNGTTAVCKIRRFLKSGAPQTPDPATDALLCRFLSIVTPKMNTWLEMAAYYAGEWREYKKSIQAGARTFPSVTVYQQQEKAALA